MTLAYTPDVDIKVHEEGAIRLICRAFQSHEAGIPEWLKNSADAYCREGSPDEKRVIVLILADADGRKPSSISCLDFSGMSSSVIENNFRIWADPEAATRGVRSSDIQGGHGNGGKCYMTQMFEDFSVINTVRDGKGNRYGVQSGSVKFGYIPDRERGRDFEARNWTKELTDHLATIRCAFKDLPEMSRLNTLAKGFTLFTGFPPKGYTDRIVVDSLLENIQDHPQVVRTLEYCRLYVIHNGKLLNKKQPITLPPIPPIEGSEQPREIKIPRLLVDPISKGEVATFDKLEQQGKLFLKTSNVSMRWTRRNRHNIIYHAVSGFIGYMPVLELDVQSPFRDKLYGECQLVALEPFKQNDRGHLANSPLTRAVNDFISKEVERYAKEFELKERRKYKKEEQDALSKINEALDKWKNEVLKNVVGALWGIGGAGPIKRPLPSGPIKSMELSLSHTKAGLGVTFRPNLSFVGEDGKAVRPVPYRWVSEDNNVAMVNEDLMLIETFHFGKTLIWAETEDGKFTSNKVALDVVQIKEIEINPPSVDLAVNGRQKLDAICTLISGEKVSDVYLEWTESNAEIARVSASGLVYGFNVGETEVTAGDDQCMAKAGAKIKVVTSAGPTGKGKKGGGYPQILLSGVSPDPDTNETVVFNEEYPPVWQRPQDADRNIWWINTSSPLAKIYMDDGLGYGHESREFRVYFVERYIEAMVQIAMQAEDNQSRNYKEWLLDWGGKAAQIQAAAALSDFLNNGKLPGQG